MTRKTTLMTFLCAVLWLSCGGPEDEPQDRSSFATGAVSTLAARVACSATKLAEVRQPASAAKPSVAINCNLALAPGDVITKRLVLDGAAARGVTVDCNGATLDGGRDGQLPADHAADQLAQAQGPGDGGVEVGAASQYHRQTMQHHRAVRIYGMAVNGRAPFCATPRARRACCPCRANAPRAIVMDQLKITAVGTIPLYISPGVGHTQLRRST